jgi:hypothetical protein
MTFFDVPAGELALLVVAILPPAPWPAFAAPGIGGAALIVPVLYEVFGS